MPAFAVIGAQWGDEGKGKIIDYLAGDVDAVVRYAGGNNAGHTVVNQKGKFELHLIPSGICWPGVYGIIGNGVVVNPDVMRGEMDGLAARGIDVSNVLISERAHVIMPYHIIQDRLEEEAKGAGAIGTTGQGVGPTYVDKVGRMGIRVGDVLEMDTLAPKLEQALAFKNKLFSQVYGAEKVKTAEILAKCEEWSGWMAAHVHPTEQLVQDMMDEGKKVLLEGAQGTLLDVDHGSYPFVTSSSPSIGGACTGLGLSPQMHRGRSGSLQGLLHAGSGAAPCLPSSQGAEARLPAGKGAGVRDHHRQGPAGWLVRCGGGPLQRAGQRVHRTGVDPARHPGRIPLGQDLRRIPGGWMRDLDRFPSNTSRLAQCEPVYEELSGWDAPTAGATSMEQLPGAAVAYMKRIEELVGCRVQIVSTGASRDETILREPVVS